MKVWITPEEAQKLPAPARLHLTLQPGNKLNVKLRIGEEEYNKQFDKLPALLTTPSGTFSFTPKDSTTVQSTQEIMATVSSPRSVANAYRGALSIEPTSKSTTIAQISVKSTHTQRGMDFINKLVEVYNRDANDDKTKWLPRPRNLLMNVSKSSTANWEPRNRNWKPSSAMPGSPT